MVCPAPPTSPKRAKYLKMLRERSMLTIQEAGYGSSNSDP
jgi:hypothetical protein